MIILDITVYYHKTQASIAFLFTNVDTDGPRIPIVTITPRQLTAVMQGNLNFAQTRTATYGSRAFEVSGRIC